MFLVYVGVFVLVCLACWALRGRPQTARRVFDAALVLAALPYLFLVASVGRTIASFRSAAGEPTDVYPGLIAFTVAGALLTLLLLAGGLRLARTRPLLAGLMPLVLGGLTWYALVPLLRWGAPGPIFKEVVVWWDNIVWIWAAGFSALAAVMLVGAAVAMRGRRASPGAKHRGLRPAI